MIRKGFWLAVGAAGGIMGYRRVTALTRQVSQTLGTRQRTPATVKRHWAREAFRFTRDVREGMDLYSSRHKERSRPTLGPGAPPPGAQSPGAQSPCDQSPAPQRAARKTRRLTGKP
jgi:hypothetical protein